MSTLDEVGRDSIGGARDDSIRPGEVGLWRSGVCVGGGLLSFRSPFGPGNSSPGVGGDSGSGSSEVVVVEVVVEVGRVGRVWVIPIIRMPMPGDNGDLTD